MSLQMCVCNLYACLYFVYDSIININITATLAQWFFIAHFFSLLYLHFLIFPFFIFIHFFIRLLFVLISFWFLVHLFICLTRLDKTISFRV